MLQCPGEQSPNPCPPQAGQSEKEKTWKQMLDLRNLTFDFQYGKLKNFYFLNLLTYRRGCCWLVPV